MASQKIFTAVGSAPSSADTADTDTADAAAIPIQRSRYLRRLIHPFPLPNTQYLFRIKFNDAERRRAPAVAAAICQARSCQPAGHFPLSKSQNRKRSRKAHSREETPNRNSSLKSVRRIAALSRTGRKWVPSFLSIYIGIGENDPMCPHIQKLIEKYKKIPLQDLTFEIFSGQRHALLFEKDKKLVYKSILKWLNERTYL